MWFQSIFGAPEGDTFQKSQNLFLYDHDNHLLTSVMNNAVFEVGPFEILSSVEIEERIGKLSARMRSEEGTGLTFENIIADVRTLIRDPYNNGSVFQVASQFNCLEMVGPKVTPEVGITNYCKDPTQGPACAIACPAATVFRNYFINGVGQNKKQVDMLQKVGQLVDNEANHYWVMRNGYCLPVSSTSMAPLAKRMQGSPELCQSIHDASCVGIHWETEVCTSGHSATDTGSTVKGSASSIVQSQQNLSVTTLTSRSKSGRLPSVSDTPNATSSRERSSSMTAKDSKMDTLSGPTEHSEASDGSSNNHGHVSNNDSHQSGRKQKVCQVFTSALPVAYAKSTPSKDWAPFACAVLEAAFDNTLSAAYVLNLIESRREGRRDGGSPVRTRVFLTCIGGGAFGNRLDWIISALGKALIKHRDRPLDVKLVHYDGIVKSVYNTINLSFGVPAPVENYKDAKRRWYNSNHCPQVNSYNIKLLPALLLSARVTNSTEPPPVEVEQEASVEMGANVVGDMDEYSLADLSLTDENGPDFDEFAMDDNETICSYISKCSIGLAVKQPVIKLKSGAVRSIGGKRKQYRLDALAATVRTTNSPLVLTSGSAPPAYVRMPVPKNLQIAPIGAADGVCGIACTKDRNIARGQCSDKGPSSTIRAGTSEGTRKSISSRIVEIKSGGVWKLDQGDIEPLAKPGPISNGKESILVAAPGWLKSHQSAVARAGRPDWVRNFNSTIRPSTSQGTRDIDISTLTGYEPVVGSPSAAPTPLLGQGSEQAIISEIDGQIAETEPTKIIECNGVLNIHDRNQEVCVTSHLNVIRGSSSTTPAPTEPEGSIAQLPLCQFALSLLVES